MSGTKGVTTSAPATANDRTSPDAPGAFFGDVWYGDQADRTFATHRWDGARWVEVHDFGNGMYAEKGTFDSAMDALRQGPRAGGIRHQESTMEERFKFKNGDSVRIVASGETGTVEGRAEYTTSENQYWMRYKAGDGRAEEKWWGESALSAAE